MATDIAAPCTHGIDAAGAAKRWEQAAGTPQPDSVAVCHCCGGPCLIAPGERRDYLGMVVGELRCSRCEVAA